MPSTTTYKRGDIVLVPFPFTDLSSSKRRPALVISPTAFNDQDVVLVAITSQLTEQRHAIIIEPPDCADGTLPRTSLVKMTKIFTMHSSLVVRKLCALREEKLGAVLSELRQFFS